MILKMKRTVIAAMIAVFALSIIPGAGITAKKVVKPTVKIKKVNYSAGKIGVKLVVKNVKKVTVSLDGKKLKTIKKKFKSFSIKKKLDDGKYKLTVKGFSKSGKSVVKSINFKVGKESIVPPETNEPYGEFTAYKVPDAPVIDGELNDICWNVAKKYPIKTNWLKSASAPSSDDDFSGEFSVAYSDDKIYFSAVITDDILTTSPSNDSKQNYSAFDCLEIFIDEDRSGGEHTFSHQAFAYHLTQAGDAIDLSDKNTNYTAVVLNKNVTFAMKPLGDNKYAWEGAITPYTSAFDESNPDNSPVAALTNGKQLGFSMAYCDSDTQVTNPSKAVRDHFIGSNEIPESCWNTNDENPMNVGWITADAFGLLKLTEPLPVVTDS